MATDCDAAELDLRCELMKGWVGRSGQGPPDLQPILLWAMSPPPPEALPIGSLVRFLFLSLIFHFLKACLDFLDT